MNHEFGSMVKNMFFFGEEVFGNQYAFTNDSVILFNIETGEKGKLAGDFAQWLNVLQADLEYLTGRGFIQDWNNIGESIEYGQRLHPKLPFVAGGECNVHNFYKQYFPTYLSSNANIAKQVYNLPEGTPIKIKIDKK
ncbi:hypothetical protein LVD17_14680 [Fulvivirga ulvae]|uniref:hypothetical protein n=1 Tax=Fulvivirga ulvae TaxID=2904245 RepID=UPI001F2843E9|nr:hypothetical protein [Fulvivirga ulvae]UII35052.1 hypothetical protein LVD17_14680 [Fulvivirga ulvae]